MAKSVMEDFFYFKDLSFKELKINRKSEQEKQKTCNSGWLSK